jgi:hypothetical protein
VHQCYWASPDWHGVDCFLLPDYAAYDARNGRNMDLMTQAIRGEIENRAEADPSDEEAL